MNRKQRQRRDGRRRAHGRAHHRPRNVLSLDAYPSVNKSHIVPAMYQRGFAVDDRVVVHIDGTRCVTMHVADAGTRRRFYRRTRPDGSSIDDVEASLAVLEDRVQPALTALQAGGLLGNERKVALIQFVAAQMLRGPAFFEHRAALVAGIIDDLRPGELPLRDRTGVSGGVNAVKGRVRAECLHPTSRLVSMLSLTQKVSSILGLMRCQLLHFGAPLLAYSDHPVVVWPGDRIPSSPFEQPHFGPLSAVEVAMPLSPRVAVLMTWQDRASAARPVNAHPELAAQLNAFVAAQSDRQWMHRPGSEPPVNHDAAVPISMQLDAGYGPDALRPSVRRERAWEAMRRHQNRRYSDDIDVAFDVA